MTVLLNRLEGWEAIGAALNRSARRCRDWASERMPAELRLPVWWLGGVPCISLEHLEAWLRKIREVSLGIDAEKAGQAKRMLTRIQGVRKKEGTYE